MIFNLHNPYRSPSVIKRLSSGAFNSAASASRRGLVPKAGSLIALMALPAYIVAILFWRWIIPFVPGLYQARTRPRFWNLLYGVLVMLIAVSPTFGVWTLLGASSSRGIVHGLTDLYIGGPMLILELVSLFCVGGYLVFSAVKGRRLTSAKQLLLIYGSAAYILSQYSGVAVLFPLADAGSGNSLALLFSLSIFLMLFWQPFVSLPTDIEQRGAEMAKMRKSFFWIAGIILGVAVQKNILWFLLYSTPPADFSSKLASDWFWGGVWLFPVGLYGICGAVIPYFFFYIMISRTNHWSLTEDQIDHSLRFPYAYVR